MHVVDHGEKRKSEALRDQATDITLEAQQRREQVKVITEKANSVAKEDFTTQLEAAFSIRRKS